MADRRKANVNWWPADENGDVPSWERVNLAVLMDIRDELRTIRGLLRCHNTLSIPDSLRRIARNTAKPKRKAKKRA